MRLMDNLIKWWDSPDYARNKNGKLIKVYNEKGKLITKGYVLMGITLIITLITAAK